MIHDFKLKNRTMKFLVECLLCACAVSGQIELSKTNINNIFYTLDDKDGSNASLTFIQVKYKSKEVLLDSPVAIFNFLQILIIRKDGIVNLQSELSHLDLTQFKKEANFSGSKKSIVQLPTGESIENKGQQDWESLLLVYKENSVFDGALYLYNPTPKHRMIQLKMSFYLNPTKEKTHSLNLTDISIFGNTNGYIALYKEESQEFNNTQIRDKFDNIILTVKDNPKLVVFLSNRFPRDSLSEDAIRMYTKTHFSVQSNSNDNGETTEFPRNEKTFLKFVFFVLALLILVSFIWVTVKYRSQISKTRRPVIKHNSIMKLD